MLKGSAEAGGLGGVAAEGRGWLEDEDAGLSSVLLSNGVRGGVGSPAEDDDADEEGSLAALLKDGFLSCTCCFCCTASSCLRSVQTHKEVMKTSKSKHERNCRRKRSRCTSGFILQSLDGL